MQTLLLSEREIAAWLRLTSIRGLGCAKMHHLLSTFGLPEAIFDAPRAALARAVGDTLARSLQYPSVKEQEAQSASVRKILAWASQPDHHWLTFSDPAYPPALYVLTDPPAILYVEGHLEYLHTPAVAIVGSRYASAQGLVHAEQFGQALAGNGITVVSGLALGIDGAAHCGALEPIEHFAPSTLDVSNSKEGEGAQCWGSTVAVMGTGIDKIYPARHQALAKRIRAQGALVSEYPLGTPARSQNFPRRNRLIAALSQAVLVVEAAIQSGSLITARLANELGRDVLAIPGSIHSPVSKGCHQLIKQGAKLVESVEDIMEELKIDRLLERSTTSCKPPSDRPPSLLYSSSNPSIKAHHYPLYEKNSAKQTKSLSEPKIDAQNLQSEGVCLDACSCSILEAIGYDPIALDLLADRINLSGATLQATLLQLELQGLVSPLPGGRVVRIRA